YKSKPANQIMVKFQAIAVQLMFSHDICSEFLTNNTENSRKYVKEVTESILKLIVKQRKEVPNMLTPDMIVKHIRDAPIRNCSDEARFFVESCHTELYCPAPVNVSFLNIVLLHTLK